MSHLMHYRWKSRKRPTTKLLYVGEDCVQAFRVDIKESLAAPHYFVFVSITPRLKEPPPTLPPHHLLPFNIQRNAIKVMKMTPLRRPITSGEDERIRATDR